jgi:putative ABC transport system substrate-binding protein
MRRRQFIAGLGGVAASAKWPTIARAQQSRKMPVLGVLWHAENAEGELGRLEALRAGLEDLGRIEGKNIKIIDTFAAEQYEQFDTNAASLVAVPVDLLFAHTQPAAMAAHRATNKIPIVFTWVPDPVQAGLVASLNRPGGNITGFSNVAVDLSGKKLQMMKEVTANSRLGFLANGNDANVASRSAQALKSAETHRQTGYRAADGNSGPRRGIGGRWFPDELWTERRFDDQARGDLRRQDLERHGTRRTAGGAAHQDRPCDQQ